MKKLLAGSLCLASGFFLFQGLIAHTENQSHKSFINNKLLSISQTNSSIELIAPYGLLNYNTVTHPGFIDTDYDVTKLHLSLACICTYAKLRNYYLYGRGDTLNTIFEKWTNEWKENEIINNEFGHVREISKSTNLGDMYDRCDDITRFKIDYLVNILRMLIYTEKAHRKCEFNRQKTPKSIEKIYSLGPELDVFVDSFESIGYSFQGVVSNDDYTVHKIGVLHTPLGSFNDLDVWPIDPHPKSNFYNKFGIKNLHPLKHYCLTKDINGKYLCDPVFWVPDEQYLCDTKQFWTRYRNVILYKLGESKQ